MAETVDWVIDETGLIRTGQALKTLEKYLERVQWRSRMFAFMRVRPVIELVDRISDKLEEPLRKLREFSKTYSVVVKVEPEFDKKLFEKKGTEAGKVFADSFMAEFDAQAADKVRSLFRTIVPPTVPGAGGSGSSNAKQTDPKPFSGDNLLDKAFDIVVGVASGLVTEWIVRRFFSKFSGNPLGGGGSLPIDPDGPMPPRHRTHGRRRKTSSGNSVPPSEDHGSFMSRDERQRASKPARSPSKKLFSWGKQLMDWGKGFLPKGGPNNNFLGSSSQTSQRMSSSGSQAAKQAANSPSPQSKQGQRSFGKRNFSGTSPRSNVPRSTTQAAQSMTSAGSQVAKQATKLAPLKSLFKAAGKATGPLGLLMSAADIATAQPGEEQNKAVGRAAFGAAGAAIGSFLFPGVGTIAGGYLGDLVGNSPIGEAAGAGIVKATKAVSKFGKKIWGGIFGGKEKKEELSPIPAPTQGMLSAVTPGTYNLQPKPSGPAPNPNPGPTAINVNIPPGAVQLNVQERLNYDQIASIVGEKIASSVQQAMENRA